MSCCTGNEYNSGVQKSVKTSPSVKAFLWQVYGSDGTRNCIQPSDFVDGKLPQAFIDRDWETTHCIII